MEAIPMFDRNSERDQEYTDRVNQLYSESLKPINITPDTILEAFQWGHRNNKLMEIADEITVDDAYLGSLVGGLVRDYLFMCAEKEAEKEVQNGT